jgi:hypothetical protein
METRRVKKPGEAVPLPAYFNYSEFIGSRPNHPLALACAIGASPQEK